MLKRYIKDNETDANDVLFSGLIGHAISRARMLVKKNPNDYDEKILTVKSGTVFPILSGGTWKTFIVDGDTDISESDLDGGGSFIVGTDYSVFCIDDGANGQLKISPNSTYPAGASADNSLKFAGFHYGHVRKVSSDGLFIPVDSLDVHFGAGPVNWKDNVAVGIVPNSIWDLVNRPSSDPEGMVKVGNIWVDIYEASAAEPISFEASQNGQFVAGGKLQSKYGMIPVTGSEGCNQYAFNELATRSGKRLLTLAEWEKAAYGNPGGEDAADNYGWTKTSNGARARTGCRVNPSTGVYDAVAGIKPYAISAFNIVDAVGNVMEWLDNCFLRWGTTGSFSWRNVLNAGGADNKGQIYATDDANPGVALAGGGWGRGVGCGPRAVYLSYYARSMNTLNGVRLACDNL